VRGIKTKTKKQNQKKDTNIYTHKQQSNPLAKNKQHKCKINMAVFFFFLLIPYFLPFFLPPLDAVAAAATTLTGCASTTLAAAGGSVTVAATAATATAASVVSCRGEVSCLGLTVESAAVATDGVVAGVDGEELTAAQDKAA
jgi:hypothetical protein